LPDDDPSQTYGIGDESIEVLFDDDFYVPCHLVSDRAQSSGGEYHPEILQPQIPPHLPVLQVEHQHPSAIVGDGEIGGSEAQGDAGGAGEEDLGADAA
jgi:hypothetical protein